MFDSRAAEHFVVPGPAEQLVCPIKTMQFVIAGAAVEPVDAEGQVGALGLVVAGAAEDRVQPEPGARDDIIAAQSGEHVGAVLPALDLVVAGVAEDPVVAEPTAEIDRRAPRPRMTSISSLKSTVVKTVSTPVSLTVSVTLSPRLSTQ